MSDLATETSQTTIDILGARYAWLRDGQPIAASYHMQCAREALEQLIAAMTPRPVEKAPVTEMLEAF